MTTETHPIFAQLACLKRQHDALEGNQHIATRALEEQACALVEAWFDGQDSEAELIASARQHVSETLQAWTREQEEGAPF
jgi:hypothetical protein